MYPPYSYRDRYCDYWPDRGRYSCYDRYPCYDRRPYRAYSNPLNAVIYALLLTM
jgi:hypothetical protein